MNKAELEAQLDDAKRIIAELTGAIFAHGWTTVQEWPTFQEAVAFISPQEEPQVDDPGPINTEPAISGGFPLPSPTMTNGTDTLHP